MHPSHECKYSFRLHWSDLVNDMEPTSRWHSEKCKPMISQTALQCRENRMKMHASNTECTKWSVTQSEFYLKWDNRPGKSRADTSESRKQSGRSGEESLISRGSIWLAVEIRINGWSDSWQRILSQEFDKLLIIPIFSQKVRCNKLIRS